MRLIVTIVGARPQFVKAAVLSRLIRSDSYSRMFHEFLVHTGQHYDENMSSVFFREMTIPEPDMNLGVGSGSHGSMTGAMLERIERVLLERKPDAVIVYGDTNSTLAGALAAAKLNIPVVHIEAGLRSRNKVMPEEQNRVIVDHLSSILFCPSGEAVRNLNREGIRGAKLGEPIPESATADSPLVVNVGDIMYDAFLFHRQVAVARRPNDRIIERLGIRSPFRLITIHRAENTDEEDRLTAIGRALDEADDMPMIFPMHPRTRDRLRAAGVAFRPHIRVIEPVGYLDMLDLEAACDAIITDSGGVQKEAFFAGKPCFTLRSETEWTETVEGGWNRLFGSNLDELLSALRDCKSHDPPAPIYGDGTAGMKILDTLQNCRFP
jgi:UDP-GlcNAc3NAcA epimerase